MAVMLTNDEVAEPDTSHPAVPDISTNGLQLLRAALEVCRSTSPSTTDAVLIAIDFEHTQHLRDRLTWNHDCQVGIAILDTRDITHSPPEKLISTINWASGSSRNTTKASNTFLFGETMVMKARKILKKLDTVIPRVRNVLLLGHSMSEELRIFQALRIKFPQSGVSAIDTQRVAGEVLGGSRTLSLRKLLAKLHCPSKNLHNAGNDAHFTLMASILLAIRTATNEPSSVLQRIAVSFTSDRLFLCQKAAKKERKRLAKSRKHQSRRWDQEQQETIRAERQAGKEDAEVRRAVTPLDTALVSDLLEQANRREKVLLSMNERLDDGNKFLKHVLQERIEENDRLGG